jgi:hypothetical protein
MQRDRYDFSKYACSIADKQAYCYVIYTVSAVPLGQSRMELKIHNEFRQALFV